VSLPTVPGSRIRVALIDDHAIVREGLKHLLETEPDLEVVAEGTDGVDTLRVVREAHPDVLLLDFAMPRLNGVDALVDLPPGGTRVILLTAALDPDDVLRAVQLGARGVVLKESATRVLIDGIRSVMEGKYVILSDVVSDFAAAISRVTPAPRRRFGLTPRELEVAVAVADGESNREVAQRLSLSLQTVKHHLSRIFDKTGVSTRLELALFAIDKGLVRHAASRRSVARRADRDVQ
jgi:two-component system nitrate/nitrite response regulator NarL